MLTKENERNKAIELRKRGLSYREILREVLVAKSTLSLWLRSVKLSKKQKQRLTEKKLASARRGAVRKHEIKVEKANDIIHRAFSDIKKISAKDLFLIGVALYWAEGSKEKEYRPGSGINFANSDCDMAKIFLKWLIKICGIDKDRIVFEIYIHENNKYRLNQVVNYWSATTGYSKDNFSRIYFKKNKINTKRKNIDNLYYGLLRIKVKASSELNRKVQGWIKGICENCRVV